MQIIIEIFGGLLLVAVLVAGTYSLAKWAKSKSRNVR